MNIRFSSLILFLFVSTLQINSQKAVISPVPQSVEWGKQKAFKNDASFAVKGELTADKDAILLLKQNIKIHRKGIQLIIGEKNDAHVSKYKKLIPEKKEGYFVQVTPGRVVIAGADSVGTYYGVQTFLQLLSAPQVMQVTIRDYPDVSERGLVEGFYGNPFSHANRLSQFEFFGKNKMNVYIYGPKDDPFHGFSNRWREPYPQAEANRMRELINKAHENKVNFVWAVHPGNDIQWTDKDGDGVIDDFKACVDKFEMMYALGVRSFAIFFDDISGIGADPVNQAKMLNYLTTEFVQKKHDVAPMILCPTQYNKAWSGGDYLSILGNQMDKSVRIMWTGNSVVDMINQSDMDWINQQIGRKAYIWLNYPVTDYVIDHLLMGPTYGNDLTIAEQLSGFISNPMEYAEASKVSLYSIADYTWNMKAYDATNSWKRAIRLLMPGNEKAFSIFCENNIDLGPTYHGLRMKGESAAFKNLSDSMLALFSQGKYSIPLTEKLSAQFQSYRNASEELIKSTGNQPLTEEIKPWLQVFDIIGSKGNYLMQMYQSIVKKDSISFIESYKKLDSLEVAQKSIISRGFKGSIKSPNPKPANEVVAPFIKQMKSMLISEYKKNYNYQKEIFPKHILEDGRYYILQNGRYLTNRKDIREQPVFVAASDTINPQRQEWVITIDPLTDRYKLVNAQDARYLNERGRFGTNKFESTWNTYTISVLNGKYAIQNGGSAGNRAWSVTNESLQPSESNKLNENSYIFEIIPVGK